MEPVTWCLGGLAMILVFFGLGLLVLHPPGDYTPEEKARHNRAAIVTCGCCLLVVITSVLIVAAVLMHAVGFVLEHARR